MLIETSQIMEPLTYTKQPILTDLTLRGSTAATFGGNTGGAATELANLIIDKGTSCATGIP